MKKPEHNPFDSVAEQYKDTSELQLEGALLKDMVLYISTFLTDPKDNQAYALALGTHSPKFFNWVSPILTEILLTHVMRGDLDAVEKMLKANKVNKYLLNKKGYHDRTYRVGHLRTSPPSNMPYGH